MKKIIILFGIFSFALRVLAQPGQIIISKLESENNIVVKATATKKQGMLITNKALNIFFANKVGSYLSEGGDLSLFNNYATLGSSDGKFSLNHNCKQTGTDDRIKGLVTIGAKVNIADAFATVFTEKKFSNEIGLTLKKTWIGRGIIYYDNLSQKQPNGVLPKTKQKDRMNVIRAGLLRQYALEITQKAQDLEASVNAIKQADVPGQTLATVQEQLRKDGYDALESEYEKKFAEQQAAKMDSNVYNKLVANWTSLSIYIPVTPIKYSVAPVVTDLFEDKKNYPFDISLGENVIIESSKNGRLFLGISGGLTINNSVLTEDATKTTLQDYKNLGGIDTIHLAQLSSADAYIGSYSNFLTPSLKAQVVYFFPKISNVGISFQAEQNFGLYNPLNGKIGIPIRLNDKDGEPTVNFEIQCKFKDMTNKILPDKNFGDKISVGLSVGLPFSSILY